MSDTSFGHVLGDREAAEAFIAETGGLPEIMSATEGLLAAIEQTRQEIGTATFAPSRFPTELTAEKRNIVEVYGGSLTVLATQRIEDEGLAGLKRMSLEIGLDSIEGAVFGAIHRLLELRADLIVSQQEY